MNVKLTVREVQIIRDALKATRDEGRYRGGYPKFVAEVTNLHALFAALAKE